MRLTVAQRAFLGRHHQNPTQRYNGRVLGMVERLAAAGLVKYDMEPTPGGKHSWRIAVEITPAGHRMVEGAQAR